MLVYPRFAGFSAVSGSKEAKLEDEATVAGDVGSHKKVDMKKKSVVTGEVVSVTGKADVGDDGQVGGNVNAGDEVKLKKRAVVSQSVISGDDIKLEHDSKILVDATAAGEVTLKSGASVAGSTNAPVTVSPLPDNPLPILSIQAGGSNETINENATVPLPPGSYGDVKVKKKGTLQLENGTYIFKKLVVEDRGTIEMNVTGGPILIKVEKDVDLKKETSMVAVGAAPASSGAEDILFQVAGSRVKLGKDGSYLGTFLAPEGHMDLKDDATLDGAMFGEKVHLKKRSKITGNPALGLLLIASAEWQGFFNYNEVLPLLAEETYDGEESVDQKLERFDS